MSKDSDIAELGRAMKDHKQLRRKMYGVVCPHCPTNRSPSILLPQQKCKVDGYKDIRPRLTEDQEDALWKACGFEKVTRHD